MHAIILLLSVVSGADDFRWQVTESPAFQWTVTERKGGDPKSAVVTPQEAVAGAGRNDSADEPAPVFYWAVQAERPELRMYAPESCPVCDALLAEIEQAGGDNVLPVKLVKFPLLNWMNSGPWFYWKSDQSPSGWSRMHGLKTLNGKRLDYLLQEWVKTQPESRKVSDEKITVCCCAGANTQSCLCLEEIRKGVKRGPCTCNARYGSRHFMDANGKPIGPAGGYSELTAQTKQIRLQSQQPQATYCPNCRRR
jgi:hypothetical protein